MKPNIFAVVLNYQHKETLLAALESLFSSDCPRLHIVLVDNNSRDGSLEAARQKFPRAHCIVSEQNRGFSAGVNLGIRFALEKCADYIFLLNPDAAITRDTLARLISAAERDIVKGIYSPVILRADKKTAWFCGGKIDWRKMRAVHISSCSQASGVYDTEYVTGCAALIHKSVFEKIGLFDERFFLYYEDADFSIRARRAGFPLRIVSGATAYHKETSEENPKKIYWLVVSGILFFRKHTRGIYKVYTGAYIGARRVYNWWKLRSNPHDNRALLVKKAYDDIV